jgi:hypothetical protein
MQIADPTPSIHPGHFVLPIISSMHPFFITIPLICIPIHSVKSYTMSTENEKTKGNP